MNNIITCTYNCVRLIIISISVAYIGFIWGGDMTKIVFLPPLELHEEWRYYQFIKTSYIIYIILYRVWILKHNKQQKKHMIILKNAKKKYLNVFLKKFKK